MEINIFNRVTLKHNRHMPLNPQVILPSMNIVSDRASWPPPFKNCTNITLGGLVPVIYYNKAKIEENAIKGYSSVMIKNDLIHNIYKGINIATPSASHR